MHKIENISGFVKIIIAISFMWSIAQTTLPETSLNKYAEYVYGLLILAIFSSAILNFDSKSLAFNYDKLYDVQEYSGNYLCEVYEDRLEKILSDKFNDDDIDVEINGEYKIESIKCKNQETYDEIMRYLK